MAQIEHIGFYRELTFGPKDCGRLMLKVRASEGPNEEAVAAYLERGAYVLEMPGICLDVLNPLKGQISQPGVQTDGKFCWPSNLPYYVRTYHLRLPDHLIAHAAANDWRPPTPIRIDNLDLPNIEFPTPAGPGFDTGHLAVIIEQERKAAAVLQSFLDPDPAARNEAIQALRPEPADFAAVFEPSVVPAIQASVDKLWNKFKPPRLKGEFGLIVHSAMSDEVPGHPNFPGGYRRLQGHLKPGLVWHTFKFVKPKETAGLAFDGLTQIGDRFVWFPKPWRAVSEPNL